MDIFVRGFDWKTYICSWSLEFILCGFVVPVLMSTAKL